MRLLIAHFTDAQDRVCGCYSDCHQPGGMWNTHCYEHLETVTCGDGTEMCNPGVWPLTHSSTTALIHFSSPSHAYPSSSVSPAEWQWGGGHRGHGGIRCHFKKQLSGLTENGAWLCSLVKTASPHSALPAAQEVCLMESIKWPVLWDWLVLPVVPNEYFHRFFLLLLDASCRWIKIASYVSHR